MKIAVVFLVAALSSCFDAASVPQTDCLQQLLQDDAPALLQDLSSLLCNFKIAQQDQNGAMFMAFLNQVNVLLAKVGCSINSLLGINVNINLSNAEQTADEVAGVLFNFLEGIIAKVSKILDDIPILGDLLNDKALNEDIRTVACGVMVDIISDVDKVLKIVSDITGMLAKQNE